MPNDLSKAPILLRVGLPRLMAPGLELPLDDDVVRYLRENTVALPRAS